MNAVVRSIVRAPLILAVLLALLLSACGGDDGGGTPAAGGNANANAGPEVKELTVGLLPVVDVAPMYAAQKAGYFQAEGLTVKFQQAQGGAAIIPAMVSGDVQVGFSNYVSLMLAKQNGIDLKIIAEGVRAKPGFSGIMTMPDSDIKGPTDLAGKKVAVNTLNNIGTLIVNSTVQTAGGDPKAVEYVELPLPEMGATLQRGDIDAAWVVEPFTVNLKTTLKAVSIADPYSGPTDKLPVAGYAVTREFAEKNPNTVAAFLRALDKVVKDIQADPAKATAVVPEYTQIKADVASQVTPPEYVNPQVDAAQIQRVADLMLSQQMLKAAVDVKTFAGSS
jgi:NitT/TauT family transport system substrate-binding protein